MMSRAFVNEDNLIEEIPDRPISGHRNYVTPQGLAQIDLALATARRLYGEAQASGNREGLAKSGRDLRYWSSRRASAQLVTTDPEMDCVQFGSAVTITRDDGRKQTFRIVGEDEADPAKGTISHVSPLATALLGKRIGDVVRAGKKVAEIVVIESSIS
jgi:transcription elongation GreA/GreB family factor